MRPRFAYPPLKWVLALVVLAGLLALAYAVNGYVQRELKAEADRKKTDVAKRGKDAVVKLGAALAASHGIKDQPARAVTWYERVPVCGRVVPNPQATLEIRSPFAGTLRAEKDSPWPVPGRPVRAGQVLGRVDIRVGPQERLDLQAKYNGARLKLKGAVEILKVQEERVGRLQKFDTTEIVSRRELDEALVQFAEARTQKATAEAAVELWEKALKVLDRTKDQPAAAWSETFLAPADGEITELFGRPGMVIEAGGLVARAVDFRHVLVRLDLPPEALVAGPPSQVEVEAASGSPLTSLQDSVAPPAPVTATLVGPAPQVDAASQFASYCYEVAPPKKGVAVNEGGRAGVVWRPGLFVKSSVKAAAAKPREAVSVPASAVLYHQGRALVYVRVGAGRYERREVQLLGREGDRWILAAGPVANEDPVVFHQAQILLSEEFRPVDVDD